MKLMKIMKNNGLYENNKLVEFDLTTVDCTYNYTHCGKVSKLYNMYNNNMCGPHKHQELRLLCHATYGVTSDFHDCILPGGIQSVLLTPYQANNKHRPLVDYLQQHIKHAHSQS